MQNSTFFRWIPVWKVFFWDFMFKTREYFLKIYLRTWTLWSRNIWRRQVPQWNVIRGVLENTERKSDVFDFSLHSFFRPLYVTLQEYTRDIQDKIFEQRRLPRSIPPDNPQNLALLHVKRHIFERSRTLQKEERDGIAWMAPSLNWQWHRGACDISPAVRWSCISCRAPGRGWRCYQLTWRGSLKRIHRSGTICIRDNWIKRLLNVW